jgi:exosortase/archaeosortase family protein
MITNLTQELKNNKSQVIKLITVIFVAVLVHFIGWNKIIKTETFHAFNTVYNDFTVKIIQNIGSVLDKDIEYNSSIKTLTFKAKSSKLIMPVEAYRYFITSFVLLLLVPIKFWKASLNAIVFVLLFVAMRAATISLISLIYKNTIHHVLLVWLDPTIFIAMLMIGLYIINQNYILNKLYTNLNLRFSEIIKTSLNTLLLLLILLPPLPRVLFTYIHSDIMPGIVSFILYFSKIFLGWMGKSAEVSGRFITLENNWIDLEYPCIGIGVFTLAAILIFAIKGKILNKVIYLLFFALVYLLLNALRLSVLLLYINNTYHQIGLNKLELHNNATYFMYVVAFCGFWGYWVGVRNNNFK